MHFLLLTLATLVLATACGLLLAGAGRAWKARRPRNPRATATRPASRVLSPLARQHAIQAYRTMRDMDLADDDTPSATPQQRVPTAQVQRSRKIRSATPKLARRWQRYAANGAQ